MIFSLPKICISFSVALFSVLETLHGTREKGRSGKVLKGRRGGDRDQDNTRQTMQRHVPDTP